MEVRRARPDEIAACAALCVRVLRETFTWQAKHLHREAEFVGAAIDEEVWVADEDGRIVGVAAFYRPQNFLHSLYVEDRGRGVGKALLDAVIARADGPVSLKVQAPNARARAFYAREGFTPTGVGLDGGVRWIRLERS